MGLGDSPWPGAGELCVMHLFPREPPGRWQADTRGRQSVVLGLRISRGPSSPARWESRGGRWGG